LDQIEYPFQFFLMKN